MVYGDGKNNGCWKFDLFFGVCWEKEDGDVKKCNGYYWENDVYCVRVGFFWEVEFCC